MAEQWTKERLKRFQLTAGGVAGGDVVAAIRALIEAVASLLPSVEEDEPRNG